MSIKRSILFFLLSSLGFYAIPTMLYFWVGLVLWLAISAIVSDTHDTRGRFFIWLGGICAGTLILTFLLYLPVVLFSGLKSLIANEWVAPKSWFWSQLTQDLKSIWVQWHLNMSLVIGIIVFAGFLLSLVFYRKICRCRVNLMLVLVVSPVVIVLIQRANIFARIWLPLFPLYCGFSFAGLFYTGKWLGAHVKLREDVVLRLKSYMPELLAVVVVAIFSVLLVAQSGHPINEDGKTLFGVPNVATVIKAVRPYMGKSGMLCVGEWPAPLYQYYYERLGLPIKQFAPNKRIDAGKNSAPISHPSEYILLFTGDKNKYSEQPGGRMSDYDLQLSLALWTAQQRGLDWKGTKTGFAIVNELKIGDYHVLFAKNNP